MLWDCGFCDTPKLLGLTHRHCPNCGAQQDPARRYYPSDADKVAVEDHQYAGRDKLCPACQGPVAAACTFCGHCGSPMDEAAQVKLRQQQRAQQGHYAEDNVKRAEAEHAGEQPAPVAKPRRRRLGWVVLLVILAVVGALVYGLCFWKKQAKLELTAHTWTRSVEIQEYSRVTESAWRDRVPANAEILRCRREKRSTRKVPDGETCTTKRRDKGDGTFEQINECRPKYREEPIHDDKCTYAVWRWTTRDTAKASGSGWNPEPAWPEVNLRGPRSGPGAQREGNRRATYTIEVTDASGERHTCDVSEGKWRDYPQKAALVGEVGRMTGSLDCDSLKRAK